MEWAGVGGCGLVVMLVADVSAHGRYDKCVGFGFRVDGLVA